MERIMEDALEKQCCFCLPLDVGARILGYLDVFKGVVILGAAGYYLSEGDIGSQVAVFGLVLTVFLVVCGVYLIIAVEKSRKGLALIFLIIRMPLVSVLIAEIVHLSHYSKEVKGDWALMIAGLLGIWATFEIASFIYVLSYVFQPSSDPTTRPSRA